MSQVIHQKILDLLDTGNADYRVLEHPPAGLSAEVSAVRGNQMHEACKALVVRAKETKKSTEKKFFLLAFPSDRKADFSLLQGFADVRLADPADIIRLTDCEIGTVPPFSFDPELQLIMDPLMLEQEKFWFNAGLLTKSIQLKSADYARIVQPTLQTISHL